MGNAILAEEEKVMDAMTLFHRFRYHLGSGFVTPKDVVLDIGCGTGYGTEILASKAKKVIGVDKEEANVIYAVEKHNVKNVEFYCKDVEKWNLPKCDVSCQFENLEHLYKPEDFIVKLKQKVKKYIIISVPTGQKLVWVEEAQEFQEEHDATHKSAFADGSVIDKLVIDDEWSKFYSIQEGVTYIVVYYKK